MDANIIQIILLGIVTENITHIFQRGKIFAPIRDFPRLKAFRGKNDGEIGHLGWLYLDELFNCPVCFSFWVAIFTVINWIYCPVMRSFFYCLIVHAVCRYVGNINGKLTRI